MTFWTIVGRSVLAFVLGGVIGWEREHEEKPAGLRTFILVCLGAALFVLLSLEITEEAQRAMEVGPTRVDPVRVIASIAQGIGFLGAGTILVTRGSVLGLTTAAAIWATSAIGVACGLGRWRIALAGTALTFAALQVLGPLTPHIGHRPDQRRS
ncbi:MAG: MgtC/SapB family protein [Anaerolineae bacterium]|jgi:putative Mg2+ transporter-C (MgtC) family protein